MKKHFFQINFEILLSDTTSLAVGTTSGYKLYSLTSTDSLDPIYSNGKILITQSITLFSKFSLKYFNLQNERSFLCVGIQHNFEFNDYDFIGRNQVNLFFRNLIKLSFYDILQKYVRNYVKWLFHKNDDFFLATDDVYIAERLFSSSLVAIVTHSAPRKLKVCHFKKGTEICNYSYTSKILAVKMNRAVSDVCQKI